jgi:prepilin signal peptidase PulO-like enzyme (type II secretory pathway)
MLPVAIIDWMHLLIPNKLIIVGSLAATVLQLVSDATAAGVMAASGVACGVLLLLVRWAASRLLAREAMGMGDIKLAFLTGLFLGVPQFLLAFWLACLLGSIVGLSLRRTRMHNRDTFVPFGSILAVTASLVLIFPDESNRMMEAWLTLLR